MQSYCYFLTRCLKSPTGYNSRRFICCTFNAFKEASGSGDGKDGDAAAKLNALLLSIVKDDKPDHAETKIQVPKPRAKQRLKKAETSNVEKRVDLGTRIVDAAKQVASKIEGDNKEIEAQLLHKLLYKESHVKDEIMKASSGNQSLVDLISKMEVEGEVKKSEQLPKQKYDGEFSRASQVRSLLGKRTMRDKKLSRKGQRINLFGEEPLSVFDKTDTQGTVIRLKTWEACEEREMKMSVTHPPSNYFEQMINWTDKGVIWKFPIDNEQGLDEEKNVSFASHVLLETHLEGWCPTSGPIRHFMELVCVGLSRNHWLSALEKEEHIKWYKDFFTQKRDLIKELGAGEIPSDLESNVTK